ncbi:hypothetical protein JCM14076_03750 [Methylosoma difficile]
MKKQATPKSVITLFTGIALALTLNACSDNNEEKAAKAQPAKIEEAHNPFDHSHDVPVTDVQKHKFEHAFADQCVQRETKNSINPDIDKERFTKPCMCIATYMMKDLTNQEAEKYLNEHENPRSLQIKFDSAAYHCLQEKTPPKDHGFVHQQ